MTQNVRYGGAKKSSTAVRVTRRASRSLPDASSKGTCRGGRHSGYHEQEGPTLCGKSEIYDTEHSWKSQSMHSTRGIIPFFYLFTPIVHESRSSSALSASAPTRSSRVFSGAVFHWRLCQPLRRAEQVLIRLKTGPRRTLTSLTCNHGYECPVL
jgi:hypothetical protein